MRAQTRRIGILVLSLGIIVAVGSGMARAELSGSETDDRLERMEQRIAELEKRLAVYEGAQAFAEKREEKTTQVILTEPETSASGILTEGVEVGGGMTGVYQFTRNANGDNLSSNSEDGSRASYSMDLELGKSFGESGDVFILLEASEGAGVDDSLKTFSGVNADAAGGDARLEMVEAWYEKSLGPVTARWGKLDSTGFIDTNAYANDETAQFLGAIFRNNPTVAFPENGAGMRVAFSPSETMEVESVFMDGDADWEDIFESSFFATQVNFALDLFDRSGGYRIYGWTSSREHTRWADANQTKEDGYGFGVSFDQALTDDVGMFVRYGWQNPKVFLNGEDFSLEHSWSTGLRIAGNVWNRADDEFGLAFGSVIASDDYQKSDSTLKADAEYHAEAYYNYQLNEYLVITPDLQIIRNPYGRDALMGDKTIVVGGVRSQISF